MKNNFFSVLSFDNDNSYDDLNNSFDSSDNMSENLSDNLSDNGSLNNSFDELFISHKNNKNNKKRSKINNIIDMEIDNNIQYTEIFTDASYNYPKDIGFYGFKIKNNDRIFYKFYDGKSFITNREFKLDNNKKIGNTHLEIFAVEYAANYCKINNIKNVIIYTDCLKAYNIYNTPNINDYDIYFDLINNIKNYNIELVKVRGHIKDDLKNDIDKEFHILDMFIRKKLRFYIDKIDPSYYQHKREKSILKKNIINNFINNNNKSF